MPVTVTRMKRLIRARNNLDKAMAQLEWAYRGLYYGNDDAPYLDEAKDRVERAIRALWVLLPELTD